MNKFVRAFGDFETKTRALLSRYPLLYGFLGAFFIVLFWKGVDDFASQYQLLTGPVLILISVPILAFLGLFLPFFAADRQLISNIKKEEDTAIREERHEEALLAELAEKVTEMDQELHQIQNKMHLRKDA